MRKRSTLAMALLFITASAWATDSLYIYSGGKKIYMPVDTTRIMVSWSPGVDTSNLGEILSDFPYIVPERYERNRISNFCLLELFGNYSFDSAFANISADNRTNRVNKVLRIDEKSSIMFGDEIFCKFYPEIGKRFVDSLLEAFGLEIVRESGYVRNRFLIKVGEGCEHSTLEIANLLFEMPETDYCHPDFVGNGWEFGYSVQDIYYNLDQWNVARAVDHINDTNYGAWEITRGNGQVLIAVLDRGMEAHTDFDESLWDGGYDFVHLDFDPSASSPEGPNPDAHGMQVLGLIAGMHNNVVAPPGQQRQSFTDYYSVAGVSPQCRVLPLRIIDSLGSLVSAGKVDTAITMTKNVGADVINCSWGYTLVLSGCGE